MSGATRGRWGRLRDLLSEALERPAEERAEFLADACTGEPELRQEAESLLASHQSRGPLDELVEAGLATSVTAASLPRPARDGERLGRYRILRQLGGGGMGYVYEARDEPLDRRVALKLLPWHLSSDAPARRRLLAEARAAAALDHPNICTVHEIGEAEDGRLYIAMALYTGGSLRERVSRGPLAVADAVGLALQAARGLEAAHTHGIVHRDIKPGNLMVSAEGVLKIVDFGVARSASALATDGTAGLGTVSYMSPEQARGEPVDSRTDIWSLGVVLYELLVGKRPFGEGTPASVLQAILEAEAPSVAHARPGVPEELTRLVARCLARQPAERYGSARALRSALEEIAELIGAPGPPGAAAVPGGDLAEEGERRPASVMVSLLAGYAELVERLEPSRLEELHGRLSRVVERVAERHGGIVNERGGDRFVCLFGVPAAHEDDAARAVRAARELHARVKELEREPGLSEGRRRLPLRTGVDWGPLIVRPGRDGLPYAVAGPPTDLAARLAAHADDDEVLVHHRPDAGLADLFVLESAPPLPLRGGELATLRVLGEKAAGGRLEVSEHHRLTPLTGRRRELSRLAEGLEAARGGEGRTVAVLGEAGAGKTRLLYEFRRLLPEGVQVLQGRCQSYGARVPYLPFLEALRERLEPPEARAADERAAVVAARLRALAAELEEQLPLYLHLLSIRSETHPLPAHLEGDALRAAIVDALAGFFTLNAHDTPSVLLLEDWHWVDRASHEVLRRISEMAAAYPLLTVVTLRPEEAPGLDLPRDWTPLRLEPLRPEMVRAMIAALLEGTEVPTALARLLHERTGGNAFFLEETVKTLRERGELRREGVRATLAAPNQLRLPATVQGVIRTRLDRLEPETRDVLRVAAVIGREFSVPILQRALPRGRPEAALERLRELGLVQRLRVLPHPTYRFQHVLTQEVAYDSLLERQRVYLHGRVARALEETAGDRLAERVDRLAYHFRRAEEWEEAVRYGRDAAERAAALSEFTEAVEALDGALACVDRLPAERRRHLRVELLFQQERHYETLGLREEQRAIVDDLIASLEPEGPSSQLARALIRRADLFILLRRHEDAEVALQRSLALARGLGDDMETRHALRSLGLLRWHQDRVEEAVEYVEEALAIDRARGDRVAIAGDLSNLGSLFKASGEPTRALACLQEALELVEELEARGASVWKKRSHVLHHLANVHRMLGNDERALECLEEGDRYARAHDSAVARSFHLTAMAHLRLRQSRIDDALRLYRHSIFLARKARHAEGLAQSGRFLGEVLLGLGRFEEALPCLGEAAQAFEGLGDEPAAAAVWQATGRALDGMGEAAEAADAWRRARALHRSRGDEQGELEAAAGLARSLRGSRPTMARHAFREALELATRLGDRKEEAALANSLSILYFEDGEYDAALEGWERVRAAARELGDGRSEGLALNSLARTLGQMGRSEEARARLKEALGLHRQDGNRLLEAHALALRGELALEEGRPAAATRDYGAALELRRGLEDRPGVGWLEAALARAAAAAGDERRARAHLARAREIAGDTGTEDLERHCDALEETLSAKEA